MRELLFVVNDLGSVEAKQSTAGLMAMVVAQGHHAWVTTLGGLAVSPDGVTALAVPWTSSMATNEAVVAVQQATPVSRAVSDFDAVWVRTNPGRAAARGTGWLELLFMVSDAGVPVLNSAAGLLRAASKLHLGSLPSGTVPRTWASTSAEVLVRALAELSGPAVLKPAVGTRGAGVVRIHSDDADAADRIREAVTHGAMLLQDYLPQAPAGDIRVHLVDGELMELGGQPCAVHRVPASGEWRSNVALGGTPTQAVLTDSQRALIKRVGPVLKRQGLWHVGLDVVGDAIVECNVYSPGGLGDAELFTGQPFTAELVRRFMSMLSNR